MMHEWVALLCDSYVCLCDCVSVLAQRTNPNNIIGKYPQWKFSAVDYVSAAFGHLFVTIKWATAANQKFGKKTTTKLQQYFAGCSNARMLECTTPESSGGVSRVNVHYIEFGSRSAWRRRACILFLVRSNVDGWVYEQFERSFRRVISMVAVD